MAVQSNNPVEVNDAPADSVSNGDTFSSSDVNMNLSDVQDLNRGAAANGSEDLHTVQLSDGDSSVFDVVDDRKMEFPADPGIERNTENVENGDKGAEAKEGFSRAVENDDGSRVEFIKTADGKEVVSTVVHPNGDKTVYSGHDADGNPTKIVDTNKDGVQTALAERNGKNVWTMSNKAINNGVPFKAAGELTISENGDHTFKDAINGNEFLRKADGTMTMKTAQGIQEIKGPDAKLREPADTSKPIDGTQEVETKAADKAEGASDVSRSVENPDGSRIEFTKTADGKEVVSTVVHPSGERTVYGGHDADGNPTNVKDFDKNGEQIGESNYDGKVWTTRHKGLNGGLPFRQVGELTVDENGTHSFKDSLTDSTFVRKANGEISTIDPTGRSKMLKRADRIERSPEPTDANGDVPAENVRMIENADGSKIEMTKLPNGNEVVTEVHYPDGSLARFSGHDETGQPTRAEDYNAKGVRVSHATREGDDWTVTNQKHNDGKPYKLPGKFEVKDDGRQVFTHKRQGREVSVTRHPSGKTETGDPKKVE